MFCLLLTAAALAFGSDYYYMNGDRRVDLVPVPETSMTLRGIGEALSFKTPAGQEIAIPDRIVVRFRSEEALSPALQRYGLRVIRPLHGLTYLLKAASPAAALEAANALNDAPDVLYAQPDIIKKWRMR